MEHGKEFTADREWMAIVDSVEQRIKASNYEMTLWLIVRQFREHVAPVRGSYSMEQMDDELVMKNRREILQGILNILKFREPDMYADILAAAAKVNSEGLPPEGDE